MMTNIFKHLGARKTSWCSPKLNVVLKGNPHHHALIFMLSCIQNQSLVFLGLSPIFGTYSNLYKLPTRSKGSPMYINSFLQAEIHKVMRKCHWGISPSTWWAHVSCLIGLNWGVVWDGPRPMLHSDAMGHATLPPFSCYSCQNMRPPSARWNVSMTYEHGFVSFGLWDCFIYIGTAWRI